MQGLKIKPKSIILLHGQFEDKALEGFKKGPAYFVLEGRPDLVSSRAIVKAFAAKKIIPTIIADNMAGFLFYKDLVKEVRLAYQYQDGTGALCDIGGLILGVLAKQHQVPVRIYQGKLRRRFLAPEEDLVTFNGKKVAATGTRVYGPLVEWLPNEYITESLRYE
jgi:translation initiation factor 2B subunit (eIF-2B alpha/beta/delta family)